MRVAEAPASHRRRRLFALRYQEIHGSVLFFRFQPRLTRRPCFLCLRWLSRGNSAALQVLFLCRPEPAQPTRPTSISSSRPTFHSENNRGCLSPTAIYVWKYALKRFFIDSSIKMHYQGVYLLLHGPCHGGYW